jgi:hypothetical protein
MCYTYLVVGKARQVKYDSIKIIAALLDAAAAADAADAAHPDHEDGGTCNMDSAYLRVPGMHKAQANTIIAACSATRIVVSLCDFSFHGRVLMLLHSRGQANRRCRMADASYYSLRASGLPSGQYLQMD